MKHPDYERTMVEALLTGLFNGDTIPQDEYVEAGMPKSKSNPARMGLAVAMMIDMRRAWLTVELTFEEQAATMLRYGHGWTDRQIGSQLKIGHTSANEMYSRTVSRLTDWLNGEDDGR